MYQVKLELAPGFEAFEPFLRALPGHFQQQGQTIHDARNRLKVMEHAGESLVVKAFQELSWPRRFIYTHWRPSKARRSFHNSLHLLSLDIATPQPVGYIEFYRDGVLDKSYFLSRRVEHDFTIGTPLHALEAENREGADLSEAQRDEVAAILEAAADFTARLHERGVLHLDYSKGNLLVKRDAPGFGLTVIDVNRMQFRPVDFQLGLKNLARLMKTPPIQEIFIGRYARLRGQDPDEAIRRTRMLVRRHSARRRLKHRIKGLFGA